MRKSSGPQRLFLRADDRVRVLHMIEACESVARFIQGRRRIDFESDQMLLFAVIRAIEVLGEASDKVSEDARSACPEIPWPEITNMRNRLIHGYFDIDVDIVWNTASIEIPALLVDLRRIAHAQT